MISKEKFVSIINEMKELHEMEDKINNLGRNCSNDSIRDFGFFSYMTCQDDTILDLLCTIFNDHDIISWWIYDLEFGNRYTDGCITEDNGKTIIDLSTAEKLYDYLIKNM